MLDAKSVRENQDVYIALRERLFPEAASEEHFKSIERELDEWLETHTAREALHEYLNYIGIIGFDSTIRNALWTLISSSNRYLTTTDQGREEWLKSMLGFGIEPA